MGAIAVGAIAVGGKLAAPPAAAAAAAAACVCVVDDSLRCPRLSAGCDDAALRLSLFLYLGVI